jgi:fructose/tagatose bisphosphate aldolase
MRCYTRLFYWNMGAMHGLYKNQKQGIMPDIIEKVAKMRKLQKNFFKYRDSLTLRACKAAEREVDQELELLIQKKKQEPTLF